MAKKEYPGQLDSYTEAREAREAAQAAVAEGTGDANTVAALLIAENLAGLAYIADGIRYSLRRQS